jgi:hypothetical protein
MARERMRQGTFVGFVAGALAFAVLAGAPGATAKPEGSARVHPAAAGHLDGSFGKRGKAIIPVSEDPSALRDLTAPMAMAVEHDGRLAVATRHRVYVLHDGHLDPRFGHSGSAKLVAPPGYRFLLADVAVDSEGRILVAGTSESLAGPTPGTPSFPGPPLAYATLYRLLPDGEPDPSFAEGGVFSSQLNQ